MTNNDKERIITKEYFEQFVRGLMRGVTYVKWDGLRPVPQHTDEEYEANWQRFQPKYGCVFCGKDTGIYDDAGGLEGVPYYERSRTSPRLTMCPACVGILVKAGYQVRQVVKVMR